MSWLTLYPWIKAFHLIFAIAWMAGLLMYPRLKIYQMNDERGGKLFEQMREAANRLRKIILTPALLMTWALGLLLLVISPMEPISQGWFHVKLLFLLIITAFHGIFISAGKKIDAGTPGMSEKKLRAINEVPFVAMIVVVIMVIAQPF